MTFPLPECVRVLGVWEVAGPVTVQSAGQEGGQAQVSSTQPGRLDRRLQDLQATLLHIGIIGG